MPWRIDVIQKQKFTDHHGRALEKEWRHAGGSSSPKIRTGQAYQVEGDLSEEAARRLAADLLADPITQDAVVSSGGARASGKIFRAYVWPKPGVSDPVGDTVIVGANDLGLSGVRSVRSGALYEFTGLSAPKEIKSFCESFLMNPLVQTVEIP